MKKKLLLLFPVLFLFLVSCGVKEKSEVADDSYMATFYPMYEFTKAIVGEKEDVQLLIPAGTEPHDYEPTTKDMMKIHDAKAFIYNSNALETWVHEGKEAFGKDVLVIEAAKEVPLLKNNQQQQDPHVWLSPKYAIAEVKEITTKLQSKFPAKKEIFAKNSEAYIKKLEELDEKYQKVLAPFKGRTFITQHTAFSYLAAEYGLKQVGVMGISEEEEPSPKRLIEIKEQAKKAGVTTLFYEEGGNQQVIHALQKETGLKVETLATLESVSEKAQQGGANYFSIMEENLKKLENSFKN